MTIRIESTAIVLMFCLFVVHLQYSGMSSSLLSIEFCTVIMELLRCKEQLIRSRGWHQVQFSNWFDHSWHKLPNRCCWQQYIAAGDCFRSKYPLVSFFIITVVAQPRTVANITVSPKLYQFCPVKNTHWAHTVRNVSGELIVSNVNVCQVINWVPPLRKPRHWYVWEILWVISVWTKKG